MMFPLFQTPKMECAASEINRKLRIEQVRLLTLLSSPIFNPCCHCSNCSQIFKKKFKNGGEFPYSGTMRRAEINELQLFFRSRLLNLVLKSHSSNS